MRSPIRARWSRSRRWPPNGRRRLLDRRVRERDRVAQEEDPRVGLEAVAVVVAQRRVDDLHRAGAVVADEEDPAPALVVRPVALDPGATDAEPDLVHVGVDRT